MLSPVNCVHADHAHALSSYNDSESLQKNQSKSWAHFDQVILDW
jgi:hypothetical protein